MCRSASIEAIHIPYKGMQHGAWGLQCRGNSAWYVRPFHACTPQVDGTHEDWMEVLRLIYHGGGFRH